MNPIGFKQSNSVFLAPPGKEKEVDQLPVFIDNKQIVSCWKLSENDIERLKDDPRIWLGVLGQGHPAVWLDTRNPFQTQPVKKDILPGDADILIHYLKKEFENELSKIKSLDISQIIPSLKEIIRKMWNTTNDLYYQKDGNSKVTQTISSCLYLTTILEILQNHDSQTSNPQSEIKEQE